MTFVKFGRGLLAGAALIVCASLTASAADAPAPTAPSPAQSAAPAPAPTAPQIAAHELTATDIEAFFDGIIPLQLGTNDIAGATVAIVKDGKVLFAKGYGFADMKTRKPVVADRTLFRPGSVTKLFTWTAVMQLVEQGKIDLDADISQYIDFELPKPFGKPITMRNLMTHRPGFEDVYKELGAKDPKKINLEAYLKNHVPAQIFEPGVVPAYSNYGAALAGYIVQRISGQPFDQYAEEHILKPLGMTHATLRQPLPDALKDDMSNGYRLASGDPDGFENVNAYPAGSMSATGTDLARFMIAHLNDGELDGQRILKAETAQAMHNTRLETDSQLNAHALGFYESTRNGQRVISHGGDTVVFHSDMHLLLGPKVGFFVSYNSSGRGDSSPRGGLWRAFLDRYFPFTPPDEPTLATAAADAQKVVGVYRSSRRGDTSWTRLIGVLQEATVTADADGIIQIDQYTDVNGQMRKWREVGPGVYRNVVGQERIVFKPDAQGTMTLLSAAPIAIMHRVDSPLEQQMTILYVAGGSLLVMALTLLLWPVAAVTRRHYGAGLGRSGVEMLLRYGTFAVCAANIAFLVGFSMVMFPALGTIFELDTSLDAVVHPWQYVGIGGAIGSLIALANALVAWGSENRGFLGKVKEWVIAIACLGFAWFAWSMHLLDLGLRY